MDTLSKVAQEMIRTVQSIDPGGKTEAGRLVREWYLRIVALITEPVPIASCRLCGSEPYVGDRLVSCQNCAVETQGDNALTVWNAVMRPLSKV